MIPERKEPQLNRTLFFPDAHTELLARATDQLALSGRAIVLDTGHEAYTRYCIRAIIDDLAQSMGAGRATEPVKVRRIRQEREHIVTSLNQSVKALNLNSSHSRNAVNTREIWIVENTQSSSAEETVFAASLLRQFKSAGISMIVTGRSVGAGQTNVEKIAELTQAIPFVLELPDLEECNSLLDQAKLVGSGSEYSALMKEIGVSVESNSPSAILPFTEEVNVKIEETLQQDYQELVSPISEDKPTKKRPMLSLDKKKVTYVSLCTLFALILAAIPVYVDFDKTLKWASSLNLGSVDDSIENSSEVRPGLVSDSSNESESLVQQQKLIDLGELVTESLTLPGSSQDKELKTEPVLLVSSVAEEDLLVGTDGQSRVKKGQDDTAGTENSLAESSTQNIGVELGSGSAGIPDISVESVLPLVNSWFIQHASFRAPQRAFLWKQNQRLDKDLKVFSKGETNARFVVVSGPFGTRDLAQSYLSNNNMGNDKFFVSSNKLGERIYP
ncbi:MAG: hypothetical protein ACJ0Q3_09055 [Candidatus Azotimanducaceae bacterium]